MRPPRRIGGRPKKVPKEGERVALSIRMTPELKRKLDEAAERGGRSLTQEAEFRLARSFDREGLLLEVMSLSYGDELAGILYMLGEVMLPVVLATADHKKLVGSWIDEPYAFDQALKAALKLLEALRPTGAAERPPHVSPHVEWGDEVARLMLEAIAKPTDEKNPFRKRADVIIDLLSSHEIFANEGQHHPPGKE